MDNEDQDQHPRRPQPLDRHWTMKTKTNTRAGAYPWINEP